MSTVRLPPTRCLALGLVVALGGCAPAGSSQGAASGHPGASPAGPPSRSSPGSLPGSPDSASPGSPPPAASIGADALNVHLAALDGIARANGGNRAVGSPGYEASLAYGRDVLARAGFAVTLDTFEAPTFVDRGGSHLRIVGSPATFAEGRDFRMLGFSGSGTVEAPLEVVDVSCSEDGAPAIPAGSIVLVRPVDCAGTDWIDRVVDAGAGAVLVACGDWPSPGFCEPELRRPLMHHLASVPVAIVGPSAAATLAAAGSATVRVVADVASAMGPTTSVIGELPGSDPTRVVIVGAHLDSSIDGPGIDDDGSGVAAVLEIARSMAGRQPTATVRVALWSAEEVGLVGSGHYVAGLGETERRRIVAYLNADVIAARNGIRGIEAASPGDAGSAALAERLAAALGALPNESVDVAGGTDTSSFSSAGIPAGGLISFTVGPKTAEQAAVYGGTADAEPDDCYHRSCDGLANAAPTLMTELTRALAQVAIDLAFGQPVSNDGHPRLSDPTAFSGGATVPPTRADSPAAP